MGFNDFMHSEKGKITTGILAAVLITTAIMVPVSIFTDRAVHGNSGSYDSVEVWGYDDQVSSTAEKINAYMEIDLAEATDIYDPSATTMSGEPTLLLNEHYHSVQDDPEILDGVYGAEGAMGYLSSSWVNGYEGQPFKMLSIYDGTLAGPTNDLGSYVAPDVTTTDYIDAQPELQATLNAHMKIPVSVADWIRPIFADTTTGLAAPTDATAIEYATWLKDNQLADDFMVSIGLFEFMSFDNENIASINTSVLPGSNATGTIDFGAPQLAALNDTYKVIVDDSSADLLADVLAQQSSTSGFYDITIDGTGTNTGLVLMEIQNFETRIDELTGENIYFNYKFVNGGSGEGWKAPEATIPGVTAKPGSDAQEAAFIGTQSRFSKESEVTAWGYAAGAELDTNDGSVYVSPDATTTGNMIGYTMGIDLPVFFIEDNFSFEYTINSGAQASSIEGLDNAKTGDVVNIRPLGISPEGAKSIYEYGASWNAVMDSGLMVAELV